MTETPQMDTPEEKIHYYQQLLKTEPENQDAYLQMGIACEQKAVKDKEPAFLTTAIARFRHVLQRDPGNELAHDHLICSSAKKGVLPELSKEYSEKLTREPDNLILKNCMKKINVLSGFSIIIPVRLVGYKPSLVFRIFFDYMLLPAIPTTCGFSLVMHGKISGGFLEIALGLFIVYIFYKWLTFQ